MSIKHRSRRTLQAQHCCARYCLLPARIAKVPLTKDMWRGEYVRVAAPFAGTPNRLLVKRGQTITVGSWLPWRTRMRRLHDASPKNDCAPRTRNSRI